jgi:hypothetical protein
MDQQTKPLQPLIILYVIFAVWCFVMAFTSFKW